MMLTITCRNLAHTQVPFQWYEACEVCLWIFLFTLPVIAGKWFNEWWLAFCVTFITALAFASINDIANRVEEPFKYNPYLIILDEEQLKFNERLIAISDTRRPLGFADILQDVHDDDGYTAIRKAWFQVHNLISYHMHPVCICGLNESWTGNVDSTLTFISDRRHPVP